MNSAPRIPPHLVPGAEVRLIATARWVDPAAVSHAEEVLRSWSLRVSRGSHLLKRSGALAGSDEQRLADINEAMRDPEVRAIFCVRGGYGSARLLDGLDLEAMRRDPKWVVGYSDVTALLLHLYSHCGLVGMHASMPVNYATNTSESLEQLRRVLFGTGTSIPAAQPHSLNRPGKAEGPLVGGNLSVIYSLLGSNSLPDTAGAVLLLEDLDEYLYHVDRMMLALQRAGLLSKLSGILVGGLTQMRDNEVPFGLKAEAIIARAVAPYAYPLGFGASFGHISNNLPWLHGAWAEVSIP